MSINGSARAFPNLANKALIADIQALEPYASSALNRKLRGIINPGVYHGFEVVPGNGLAVLIQSPGYSAAAVEVSSSYLITVRQQSAVSVSVPAGRRSVICLKAYYAIDIETDQVNADSEIKATEIVAVNVGDEPEGSIILAEVDVPSGVTAITAPMIDLLRRQSVSLEGFWEKTSETEIRPKMGLWARAQPGKGFLPSVNATGSKSTDYLGKSNSWFKEAWADSFRGGRVDVTGPIRSNNKNALLVGDFGLASTSVQLEDGFDLHTLPAVNAHYRGGNLKNAPSTEWFYIKTEVSSDQYMRVEIANFGGTKEYWCTKVNQEWRGWNTRYSTNFKPTKSDVGLSNVANERQYSALNKPTPADLGAAPASHSHPWGQVTGIPVYATRWPTKAEVGLSNVANERQYSASNKPTPADLGAAEASHTHPWGQVTGIPVYATRWPTKAEVGLSNVPNTVHSTSADASTVAVRTSVGDLDARTFRSYFDNETAISGAMAYRVNNTTNAHIRFCSDIAAIRKWLGVATASHSHTWGQISGIPATASRWPTKAEVGLSNVANERQYSASNKPTPADLGAAPASHTHPWGQVTGIPVYATRWPSKAEVGLSNVPNTVHSDAAVASTVAVRDASGDLNVRLIRSGYNDTDVISGAMAFRINNTTDPYIRFCSDIAAIRKWLGVATASHSHTWGQISGIPATASRWPTKAEVGLSNVANERQYSASNKPTLADLGAAAASHTHTWEQVTGIPVYATRWPNKTEVGLSNVANERQYSASNKPTLADLGAAAASHTHPWGQVTGIPVYATRWPTKAEVGLSNVPNTAHTTSPTANTVAVRDGAGDIAVRLIRSNYANQATVSGAMAFRINNTTDPFLRFCSDTAAIRAWLGTAPASHGHSWGQISGIPATASRWPSKAEVGLSNVANERQYSASNKPTPADLGAAPASHTHPWGQVTGIPVYATRWPSKAEVGLSNVPNYAITAAVNDASDSKFSTAGAVKKAYDLAAAAKSAADGHAGNKSNPHGTTKAHVGLSNVANERQYSASNKPTLAELGAAPASHGHSWGQITGIPAYASRWPNWSEVPGKPVYATRWPTWKEISGRPSVVKTLESVLWEGSIPSSGGTIYTLKKAWDLFDAIIVIGTSDNGFVGVSTFKTKQEMLALYAHAGTTKDWELLSSAELFFYWRMADTTKTKFKIVRENGILNKIIGLSYIIS